MSQLPAAVRDGFYARSQLLSRSRVIAWSHRGRFATGLALAREIGGVRVLDFGCGDGTFLAMLAEGPDAPLDAVGAEIEPPVVADCTRRFAGRPGLRFTLASTLDDAGTGGTFDTIYCMEVLEHVVDPVPVLDTFARLLRPGGTLVVSVPIETGLPVVVKQAMRRVAGWRGVGHYPGTTGYRPAELVRSLVAGEAQHIERPTFARADGSRFCDHKGFNWRSLRARLRERFDLTQETTSPVAWLGPQLGTQRWLVARRREQA